MEWAGPACTYHPATRRNKGLSPLWIKAGNPMAIQWPCHLGSGPFSFWALLSLEQPRAGAKHSIHRATVAMMLCRYRVLYRQIWAQGCLLLLLPPRPMEPESALDQDPHTWHWRGTAPKSCLRTPPELGVHVWPNALEMGFLNSRVGALQ